MLTKSSEESTDPVPHNECEGTGIGTGMGTGMGLAEPEVDPVVVVKRARSRISKKIKPIGIAIDTNPCISIEPEHSPPIANIILHLACSLQDMNAYNESCKQQLRATSTFTYDPTIPPTIQAYNTERAGMVTFVVDGQAHTDDVAAYNQDVPSDPSSTHPNHYICSVCSAVKGGNDTTNNNNDETEASIPSLLREASVAHQHIHTKLKKLKTLLYKNIPVTDNKSACFWCTFAFEEPECHIPFYNMNGQVHGYGVFCRPECAVGYLMKEHLDDSTKFERYHLLNRIYGKVFDYKKNIKPAPNPFYMLDRYGGNLTIEEYRALLQSNHILFTIDKPMTRTLPELHEETDDVITSMYENLSGIKLCGSKSGTKAVANHTTHMGGGTYKAKRQSEKVQHGSGSNHKTNILREHFGLGHAT